MKRIHDSLERVFHTNRLVFWYDPNGEWAEAFDAFDATNVIKLSVAGNEFGTKVRIVREPNAAAKFLIYVPTARPADVDNWLLDLLLQGYEFRADKASLLLEDVGLPQEFRFLAEEHAAFFKSTKRIQALRAQIDKDDQARDLRLKMMAILVGTTVEVDGLVLHLLAAGSEPETADPVSGAFESAGLLTPFWRELEPSFGYAAPQPSLVDFAMTLFRSADPLDRQHILHPHTKVFFQRWKDSQTASESFRQWSRRMEKTLNIKNVLNHTGEHELIGDSDTFEIFEKFVLSRLCEAFERGGRAPELRAIIQKRRSSFWINKYKHGYAAVEHALELRELLASVELAMEGIDSGLTRYVATWWRIDRAYRRCMVNVRLCGEVALTEKIEQWADRVYVNEFLLPLSDRWSDVVHTLKQWQSIQLPAQRAFFDHYVQPFRDKGQKVFVIVSDALRYEAAVDFAEQLNASNRWTAEVNAMLGALPSYTQLGMASLLPGTQWQIDATSANATVTVDGQSATGTENREKILNRRCGGKAILMEDFLAMNSNSSRSSPNA